MPNPQHHDPQLPRRGDVGQGFHLSASPSPQKTYLTHNPHAFGVCTHVPETPDVSRSHFRTFVRKSSKLPNVCSENVRKSTKPNVRMCQCPLVSACRPHTTRSASQYVRTDSHRFRAITYTLSYGSFSLTIHFRVARATRTPSCRPSTFTRLPRTVQTRTVRHATRPTLPGRLERRHASTMSS